MSNTSTFLADVGNSRLKVARHDPDGLLGPVLSLPIDEPQRWHELLRVNGMVDREAQWLISTVRPAASDALRELLAPYDPGRMTFYRSAADVPVAQTLARPDRTGADRALAVFEAVARNQGRGPLGLVLCGTAITVERVDEDGVWCGGAIAPGLGPMSEALSRLTAQLPRVDVKQGNTPIKYADHTAGAIEAGLYWSLVGAVRELTATEGDPEASVVSKRWTWTGGDAEWLARAVAGPAAQVVPDLVLHGLARLVGRRDR